MSLPTGSRLGPYEIVSALGAGGMGEVFRARDTRLDRTVAIKLDRTVAIEVVNGTPQQSSVAPLTVVLNWPAAIQK